MCAQLFIILVYLTREQKYNTWWIVSEEQHSFSKEGEEGPAVDKYWLRTMLLLLEWGMARCRAPPLTLLFLQSPSCRKFFFYSSFFYSFLFHYIGDVSYLFNKSSLFPFIMVSFLHPEINPAQFSGCNPSLTILNDSYLWFSLWSHPLPVIFRPLLSLYEYILRDPLWQPALRTPKKKRHVASYSFASQSKKLLLSFKYMLKQLFQYLINIFEVVTGMMSFPLPLWKDFIWSFHCSLCLETSIGSSAEKHMYTWLKNHLPLCHLKDFAQKTNA